MTKESGNKLSFPSSVLRFAVQRERQIECEDEVGREEGFEVGREVGYGPPSIIHFSIIDSLIRFNWALTIWADLGGLN